MCRSNWKITPRSKSENHAIIYFSIKTCYHLLKHIYYLFWRVRNCIFLLVHQSRQLRYAKIASSVINKLIFFPVPNLHTLESKPICDFFFFNFSKIKNLILISKTSKFLLRRKKGDVRLLVHLMAIFYIQNALFHSSKLLNTYAALFSLINSYRTFRYDAILWHSFAN